MKGSNLGFKSGLAVIVTTLAINATSTVPPDTLTTITGFLLNLIATLLGVFIAFLLTFEYDRRRKASQDNEVQRQTVSAIGLELRDNLDQIKRNRQAIESQSGVPVSAVVLIFHSSAYQSAISIGSLSRMPLEIQVALSNIYLEMRFIETFSQKSFQMLGTETANQNWGIYRDRVRENMLERMSRLETDIPKAQVMMGIAQEITRQ